MYFGHSRNITRRAFGMDFFLGNYLNTFIVFFYFCVFGEHSVHKVADRWQDTWFIMMPLGILSPWVHKTFSGPKINSPFVATLSVPIIHIVMIGPIKSGALCKSFQCIARNWWWSLPSYFQFGQKKNRYHMVGWGLWTLLTRRQGIIKTKWL